MIKLSPFVILIDSRLKSTLRQRITILNNPKPNLPRSRTKTKESKRPFPKPKPKLCNSNPHLSRIHLIKSIRLNIHLPTNSSLIDTIEKPLLKVIQKQLHPRFDPLDNSFPTSRDPEDAVTEAIGFGPAVTHEDVARQVMLNGRVAVTSHERSSVGLLTVGEVHLRLHSLCHCSVQVGNFRDLRD